MKSKIWTVALIIVCFFFVLTFSIAVPIWSRTMYYGCVDSMNLVEVSGFTREQIIEAYDAVMNYLNFGTPFSTGDLTISDSAKSHFEDCKVLFDLDTYVLLFTFAFLAVALILAKKKIIKPVKFAGFPFVFFSGICGIVIPLVVGGLASLDFDAAFTVFHKIFFPGKENWHFDWYDDEIIRILPEDYFMYCGILAIAALFVISLALVVYSIIKKKRAEGEKDKISAEQTIDAKQKN